MRKVLAIDPSIKRTGWAFGLKSDAEGQITTGNETFQLTAKEKKGLSMDQIQGEQMLRFSKWVQNMIREWKPNEICMEKAFVNVSRSTEILLMIRGAILVNARHFNIPCFSYATSSLKSFALTPGYNTRYKHLPAAKRRKNVKIEMVEAMAEIVGISPVKIVEDEADAFHCLQLHLATVKA